VVDVAMTAAPAPWRRRGRIDRPLPLLGPPWAEALLQFSRTQLRDACEKRGLAVRARMSRDDLAQLLLREQDRAQAEKSYQADQIPFPSHDAQYPLLCELIARHRLQHLLDLGCGPGICAQHVLRDGVLPADGSYLGVDNVPAAIALAQRRLDGEPRARFALCDLAGELPRAPRIDGVLLSFVLSYLDTHTVDRLMRRLARAWPRATVLVVLSIYTCLNGRDERVPDERARRYLAGDRRALAGWDARRLLCYTRAVDDHFGIVDEHRYDDAGRFVWVARRAQRRPG
jgi:SAM-dependent methyltransferase